MTTLNATFEQTRRQASTFTTAVTIIALLLGWGLKTYVEGRTRPVKVEGISAQIPAGWVIRESDPAAPTSDDPFQLAHPDSAQDPNLVFTAWNPLHPEKHYSVSLYPGGEETTLPSTAAVRTLNRGMNLKLYRVIEETPILVNGRDGYKVSFAYVDPGSAGEIPVVIQGIDYYFAQGNQTLIITLEVDNGNPDDHLPAFLKFSETVDIGG
jgi:hypothetical protein